MRRIFKYRCSKLGMTLMELMVSMAIGTTLSISTISTMTYLMKGTVKSQVYNRVNQEAHLSSDIMMRDFRMAAGLESSYANGTYSFSSAIDEIILKVPSINVNEDIIDFENTFDRFVYFVDDNNGNNILKRAVFPDPSSSRQASFREIGTGAFAIKPDALGVYVMNYQFKSQRSLSGKTVEMPVSGSVRLRNKN